MIDIPTGWDGTGSEGRGATEEFVLQGSLNVGGVTYVKWGYACRARGRQGRQLRLRRWRAPAVLVGSGRALGERFPPQG